MYENCIKCPKLGVSCDGPNCMAMPPHELVNWCRDRKAHLQLSNARLAELSGMPKGTVDRVLSNTHEDFKYATVRPLLQVLIGSEWGCNGCPYDNEAAPETAEALHESIAEKSTEINRLHAVVDKKNKMISALSIALGVLVFFVMAVVIYDRMNPNVGWFRGEDSNYAAAQTYTPHSPELRI